MQKSVVFWLTNALRSVPSETCVADAGVAANCVVANGV